MTAITGTLIEMILVAAGAFTYLHPDVFGVPYWLPYIYAIASLAVGDLEGRLRLSLREEPYEATRLPVMEIRHATCA